MKTANKKHFGLNTASKLIILFSVTGFAISSYLTYLHYANARSFCDLSENVSCDVVTTSIYSEIFGFPISILGVLYFAFSIILLLRLKENAHLVIFFVTLFVLFPSYYLTAIEAFVIKAWCILCESSKLLMIGTLVLSFTQIRQKFKETARMAVPVVMAGLVAVAVTFFAQTGNVVKEDYSEFAEALNAKGVVYYKSVRCNNCKRQERTFGKAYTKLNSVECHPDGPNPKPELCLKRKIDKTPTFLIEINGQEVKRLEGLNSLEKIAKWADVPFEKQ